MTDQLPVISESPRTNRGLSRVIKTGRSRSRSMPPRKEGISRRDGSSGSSRSSARGKKIGRSRRKDVFRPRPNTQTSNFPPDSNMLSPDSARSSYAQQPIAQSHLGSAHVIRPNTMNERKSPKTSKLSPMGSTTKKKRRKSTRKRRSRDVSPRSGRKEGKGNSGRRTIQQREKPKILVFGGADEKILCLKFFPTKELLKNHWKGCRIDEERRQNHYRNQLSGSSSSGYGSPKSRTRSISIEGKVVDPNTLGESLTSETPTRTRRKSSKKKKKKKRRSRGSSRSSRSTTPYNEELLSPSELGVYQKRNFELETTLSFMTIQKEKVEGSDRSIRRDSKWERKYPTFVPEHRYFYSIQRVNVGRSTGDNAKFLYYWKVNNEKKKFLTTGVRIINKRINTGRRKDMWNETPVNFGTVRREHFITPFNHDMSSGGPLKRDQRVLNAYGRERKRWNLPIEKVQEVPMVMSFQFTNHDTIIKRVGKMGLCKHMYFNFVGDNVGAVGLTEQFMKKIGGQRNTVNTTYVMFNPSVDKNGVK